MTEKPWLIAETNWKTVREYTYEVAVLPWGATEPHNYHLPYATDNMESEYVAAEAGRLAWDQGARVAILPAVPFGVQTGMLDLPFAVNMNPSTQEAVLGDIARSLEGQGIRKLLVLNGHGGNNFRQMIRELQPDLGILLLAADWYRAADWDEYFTEPGDHAGEFETSAMMHIRPDLVRPLSEAGDGHERKFRLKAMKEGWVWTPREWSEITEDTGVGNPKLATAEKGSRFLEACTRNLAGFLVELADTDPDDIYEPL
ncbi:MAG: creatininase family protein [Balneolaceae bacterium]|nr:MAG: creatininase family protein [Balneolaceae bacterium]